MTDSGHRRRRGENFDTADDRFRLFGGGQDDLLDDPFDDEDEVDELLRHEFNWTFPVTQESDRVLDEIRPTFVRARRRHRAKQTIASVAVGVTATAAGLVAFAQLTDSGVRLQTAPAASSNPEPTQPEVSSTLELPVTSPAEAKPPTTTAGERSQTSEQPTSTPPTSTPSTSTPSTSTPPPSAAPTSTSSEEASTVAPTTSTSAADSLEETIESPCGSVVVRIVGSSLELVEAVPQPRFNADVKATGPDEIEVSFEGSESHCEIKAVWEDGELHTDIENE